MPKATNAKVKSLEKRSGLTTERIPSAIKPIMTSLERRLGITRIVMMPKAIKAIAVSIFAIFLQGLGYCKHALLLADLPTANTNAQ